MPIAHCLVTQPLTVPANLVELWAREAGVAPDDMTLNLISCDQQMGQPYALMATLYLPTLWPKPKIAALQVGLARALAAGFQQPIEQVHVITTMVEAGFVVEAGEVLSW